MSIPIIVQGHFLHHSYSGQGVFLEEMLRAWSSNAENQLTVLVWYKTEEQRRRLVTLLEELPRVTPIFCRLSSWLPFRLTLGIWEFLWIPWYLAHQKKRHHYFSPTLHPMLWHPKRRTATLQMVLHDVFQFADADYNNSLTRRLYNVLLRRTARHKRVRLWTISQTSRADIERLVTPGKEVAVAGNGIDHLQSTAAAPWEEVQRSYGINKPFLLYQGGYDARKNVSVLLDVFRRLREQHPELLLVLCGNSLHATSLYSNLQALTKEPGVIHTGFVSRSVLRTLFAEATVVASPSRAEGFNIVIGEALMEGATVIASRIPAHEEFWGQHALLTDFSLSMATDALFEEVLAGTKKSPKLSTEEKTALSWAVQAGKIHATFV